MMGLTKTQHDKSTGVLRKPQCSFVCSSDSCYRIVPFYSPSISSKGNDCVQNSKDTIKLLILLYCQFQLRHRKKFFLSTGTK